MVENLTDQGLLLSSVSPGLSSANDISQRKQSLKAVAATKHNSGNSSMLPAGQGAATSASQALKTSLTE